MTTGSRSKFRTTLFIVMGVFVATHLLFWLLPNVFKAWSAQTIDRLFVLRSGKKSLRPAYDTTVAHVDLNNSTIERLESHYLNRFHFARVVENLAAMGVSAQLYDFIFAARMDDESDARFVSAVSKANNAYFGLAFRLVGGKSDRSSPESAAAVPMPVDKEVWHPLVEGDLGQFYTGTNSLSSFRDLSRAARGEGSLSVQFDPDGVLRRVPLLVRSGDGFYPFLAFRVVCDYLGMTPDRVVIRPGKHILLKGAQRPGETHPRDIAIPIDRHGHMIVNYIGPWGRMDHYNFADILLASDDQLELELWREELRGRIVVVSDVSTGSTDVGPVPVDPYFPLGGVHANIAHTILTGSFLAELPEPVMIALEASMMLAALVLSLRFSSLGFSLGTASVMGVFVAAVCASFLYAGVIIDVVRPVTMLALALTAILIYRYVAEEKEKLEGLRQRDFIRSTFGRYLSNEVVEELLDSPEGLKMSGEIREVTFLVSDLRGFTNLSSRLTPHEVIGILNRYFERMIDIVGSHRGTVSEFRGDGMLVFFGAPLAGEDDAARGVACAIRMQNALVEINEEQRAQQLPELGMGIGIHTGEVVVGNIGCEKRASYGAVGSPINTAFRIESHTVAGQILISPATYEKVKSLARVRNRVDVSLKGLEGNMSLYDVDATAGPYDASLTQPPAAPLAALALPISARCYPIHGKTVSDQALPGKITRLSSSQAEIVVDGHLDERTNVALGLDPDAGEVLPHIYAKAISADPAACNPERLRVTLTFTFVPENARTFLERLLGDSKGSAENQAGDQDPC